MLGFAEMKDKGIASPVRLHSKLYLCHFLSSLFLLGVSMSSSSPFINIHNMMALTTALHSLISPPLNATLSRCAKMKRHQIKTLINYVATSPTFSGLTFSLPVALMSEPGYGLVSTGLCVATTPAALMQETRDTTEVFLHNDIVWYECPLVDKWGSSQDDMKGKKDSSFYSCCNLTSQ